MAAPRTVTTLRDPLDVDPPLIHTDPLSVDPLPDPMNPVVDDVATPRVSLRTEEIGQHCSTVPPLFVGIKSEPVDCEFYPEDPLSGFGGVLPALKSEPTESLNPGPSCPGYILVKSESCFTSPHPLVFSAPSHPQQNPIFSGNQSTRRKLRADGGPNTHSPPKNPNIRQPKTYSRRHQQSEPDSTKEVFYLSYDPNLTNINSSLKITRQNYSFEPEPNLSEFSPNPVEVTTCDQCKHMTILERRLTGHKHVRNDSQSDANVPETTPKLPELAPILSEPTLKVADRDPKMPEPTPKLVQFDPKMPEAPPKVLKPSRRWSYWCDQCSYRTLHEKNLARHKLGHTGSRPFACRLCTKSFPYQVSLDYHLLSAHRASQPFLCDHCEYRASSRPKLEQHQKQAKCQTCARTYDCQKMFTEHKNQCGAAVPGKVKPNPGARYDCERCHRVFSDQQGLDMHVFVWHEGTMKVSYPKTAREEQAAKCNPSTAAKICFREQYMGFPWSFIEGGGESSFKCDTCGQFFPLESRVTRHIRQKHAVVRAPEYRCALCEYVTRLRCYMKQHLAEHAGTKHVCKFCGKKFARKNVRNTHVRNVHIKESSFSCKLCEFTARWQRNMVAHVRRKHGPIKGLDRHYRVKQVD